MSTRTIWKGTLTVVNTEVNLLVRIVTIDASAGTVSFNHAHRCSATTLTRLQQKKWCPTCDRQLKQTDVVRVFEYAPGQYLEITDTDLATCEPAPSSTLTITAMLEQPLNPLCIAMTARLIPDGPAATALFEMFRAGLGTMHAIGQLVLQKRAVYVAIAARARGCVLYLLRTGDQVNALIDVDATPSPTVSRARVHDMRTMLRALVGRFTYADVRDYYGVNVRTLLTARVTAATRDATRGRAASTVRVKAARRRG